MKNILMLFTLAMLLSSGAAFAEDEKTAKEGFKEVHEGMKKVVKTVDKNAKKGFKKADKEAKKDLKTIDREAKQGWKKAGNDIKKATKD